MSNASGASGGDGFTAEEKAAMKARAAELRAEAKREKGAAKAAAELADVLAAIAAMGADDRAIGERVHELVTAAGPQLAPRTWYGMPAYALDGKVVCFFKSAGKFDGRYCELGFNESAQLDDGSMWPTVFAITAIGPAESARITELVKRAIG